MRRDWPHLQWWRAIKDDGLLEKGSEQEGKLIESGFELEETDGKEMEITLKQIGEHLMSWDEEAEETVAE